MTKEIPISGYMRQDDGEMWLLFASSQNGPSPATRKGNHGWDFISVYYIYIDVDGYSWYNLGM